MRLIKNKNFSRDLIIQFAPQPGDIYADCNFDQKTPYTVVADVHGLTFRLCNLTNCVLPADAVFQTCRPVQISRCGHLDPDFTCHEDCSHRISHEPVVVDGMVVGYNSEYRDTVL